jgi:hypothetical protein
VASEDRPAVRVTPACCSHHPERKVVVERQVLTDRRDFVRLLSELTRAVDEAFPVVESLNWRADRHRSDDSGTIGTRASGRKRVSE